MAPSPRRLSRLVRILIPVSILGIVLLAVGTVGFVEYSSQPGFCNNCHIMQPYYDSWTESSHRNVACIKCHIAPGIKAEAMTKIEAANMVVSYLTGSYGTKPWAEIEDAACLRSGCHSERLIEGLVEYKGVRFDHTKHLGELRRGIQLRCTSCHSQIVQGTHIAVTESACYLCHFQDRPKGAPLAGCTGCHPSPPRLVSQAGFMVDHSQYVKDQVSCLSCHQEVTHGDGAVEQTRCFSCHNEPERIGQFQNAPLMHRVHIAEHDVACIQCHAPLEHRVVALTPTMELDCGSCHSNVHVSQQRLYAGTGGHGTPEAPSSMFLARVTCSGCHEKAATLRGHDQVQVAGEASCMSCHGIRYANILPAWQRDTEAKVARVKTVVDRAIAASARAPRTQRPLADSLLRLARENVELVGVGKGAHNVAYADRLLRASLTLVRDAVRRGGVPFTVPAVDLGPPISENACLQCHAGVARQAGAFLGRPFEHAPHVTRSGMQCTACHTSLDKHGGTTLTRESCDGCHHPATQPLDCARCHEGAAGAPQRTLVRGGRSFPHPAHAKILDCSTCHTPPTMSARELTCETCHAQDHTPEGSCLSCHKGGAQAKHKFEGWNHPSCTQCHASKPGLNRWSRAVCTACHADKTEHYKDGACEVCHQIAPMDTTETTAARSAAARTLGRAPYALPGSTAH
jgi:nitrate/TMAO reductase-like tetraheme cytochrome c subunit